MGTLTDVLQSCRGQWVTTHPALPLPGRWGHLQTPPGAAPTCLGALQSAGTNHPSSHAQRIKTHNPSFPPHTLLSHPTTVGGPGPRSNRSLLGGLAATPHCGPSGRPHPIILAPGLESEQRAPAGHTPAWGSDVSAPHLQGCTKLSQADTPQHKLCFTAVGGLPSPS